MGIILGTGSLTRFIVEGSLPEDYLEIFPQKIARYAFRNFDENSEEERSVGWVNVIDMFDNAFTGMEYLKEPYLAMSWRVDTRKVPSKALKQYCRETEHKIMRSEELEYLPKNRREEIRNIVKGKLRKRAIPSSHTYDMIWNLQSSQIIFGATSNKLCEEFGEFFFKCFKLRLESVFPYFTACRFLEKNEGAQELLDDLRYSIQGEMK
jgi:DNA recombination-dependent growth factor C